MKFIIVSTTKQSDLTALLHDKGHFILGVTRNLDDIPKLILKHAPHGVFVCGKSDASFVKCAIGMTRIAPDQVVLLRDPEDHPSVVDKQLLALERITRLRLRPPIPDYRNILFDDAFGEFVLTGKLNAVESSEEIKGQAAH